MVVEVAEECDLGSIVEQLDCFVGRCVVGSIVGGELFGISLQYCAVVNLSASGRRGNHSRHEITALREREGAHRVDRVETCTAVRPTHSMPEKYAANDGDIIVADGPVCSSGIATLSLRHRGG